MRGCLTFIVGLLLGAGLMLLLWPRVPAGQSIPQRSDLRVQISNSYLSRTVEQRASGLGLSDVTITSVPPSTMVARGTLTVAIVSAPISLQFQPLAQNGALQVRLIEAQVGNIPLPGELIPIIADSINSSLRNAVSSHAYVRAARVTPTGLDIAADYR